MQVSAAILCDFASVRENLITIVGGGVTRVIRPEFPAPMGVALALVLELHQMELGKPHELEVLVQGQDGEQVASIVGGFNLGRAQAEPGETVLAPMPFDLRNVGVPAPGVYSIEVAVDGTHQRTLRFSVSGPSEPETPGS